MRSPAAILSGPFLPLVRRGINMGGMAQGNIVWFDKERGYGFIRPDMGPKDVFMHVSALADAGLTTIEDGARVEFELVQTSDGKLTARSVQPLRYECDRRAP